MGYFSNFKLQNIYRDSDGRWPSQQELLMSRICDLCSIYEQLKEAGAPRRSSTMLSDDDIRFALPDYFTAVCDVEKAIELALCELNQSLGLEGREDIVDGLGKIKAPKEQISLFETIPFPSAPEPQKAA